MLMETDKSNGGLFYYQIITSKIVLGDKKAFQCRGYL